MYRSHIMATAMTGTQPANFSAKSKKSLKFLVSMFYKKIVYSYFPNTIEMKRASSNSNKCIEILYPSIFCNYHRFQISFINTLKIFLKILMKKSKILLFINISTFEFLILSIHSVNVGM